MSFPTRNLSKISCLQSNNVVSIICQTFIFFSYFFYSIICFIGLFLSFILIYQSTSLFAIRFPQTIVLSKSFSRFWFCVNLATFYSHIIIFTGRMIIFLSKVFLSVFRAVFSFAFSHFQKYFSLSYSSLFHGFSLSQM